MKSNHVCQADMHGITVFTHTYSESKDNPGDVFFP